MRRLVKAAKHWTILALSAVAVHNTGFNLESDSPHTPEKHCCLETKKVKKRSGMIEF